MITFKQFVQLTEMSDQEFAQVYEGLSDIPGFGWLKGPDTAAKKQKIEQARKQLLQRKDAASKERAAALDAALMAFADGRKPGAADKPRPQTPGEIPDRNLPFDDQKLNRKMDRMRSQ